MQWHGPTNYRFGIDAKPHESGTPLEKPKSRETRPGDTSQRGIGTSLSLSLNNAMAQKHQTTTEEEMLRGAIIARYTEHSFRELLENTLEERQGYV